MLQPLVSMCAWKRNCLSAMLKIHHIKLIFCLCQMQVSFAEQKSINLLSCKYGFLHQHFPLESFCFVLTFLFQGPTFKQVCFYTERKCFTLSLFLMSYFLSRINSTRVKIECSILICRGDVAYMVKTSRVLDTLSGNL